MRTVIVSASLATLVLVAGPSWAQRPKGGAKPSPKPGPVATEVVVTRSYPAPDPLTDSLLIPLSRGTVWTLTVKLQSGRKTLPPNLPVQLFLETGGRFYKVTEGKFDPRSGSATLRWKVGPAFPAGLHRWYLQFPGGPKLKASRSAEGVVRVG